MMVFQIGNKQVRKRIFAVIYQYQHKVVGLSAKASNIATKAIFKRMAQAQRQLVNKSRRLRPFAETIEGIREQKQWLALNEWAEKEYLVYSQILGPLHQTLEKERAQLQADKLAKAKEDALTLGNTSVFQPNKASVKVKTSIKASAKAESNWNVARVNTQENGKSRFKSLEKIEHLQGLAAGEIEKACKIRGLEPCRNKHGVLLRKRTIAAINAWDNSTYSKPVGKREQIKQVIAAREALRYEV